MRIFFNTCKFLIIHSKFDTFIRLLLPCQYNNYKKYYYCYLLQLQINIYFDHAYIYDHARTQIYIAI